MDDNGQRENGRHKADQYRSVHGQWMMPQYQMKDNHTIKLLAERDQAIRERNIALSEKKLALAERDMAILQRDAAVAERNTALMERDNAVSALEHACENAPNGSCERGCPKQSHHHHHDHPSPPPQLSMDPYDHSREMHIAEAYPISIAVRKPKRSRKQPHVEASTPRKKASKPAARKRVSGGEWTNGEDLNKQGIKHPNEWKDQDSGLNLVAFDETTMPVPVCSCTGKYQPCYKWGSGGWQSACCTTTLSMYPLPVMANKRHSRVGGRKMSGNVFTRVLSRMAAKGHDLSVPLDLKDHWSKHGTNRYITIK